MEGLANKLQGTERFDDMLNVSRKLRLEQDEQVHTPLLPPPPPTHTHTPLPRCRIAACPPLAQVKLMDRLKEQKSMLLQAEHRLNQMVAMLNEKRTNEAGEALQQGDASAATAALTGPGLACRGSSAR